MPTEVPLWFIVAVICTLAILSKLISSMIIGIVIHRSTLSGLEIWANMISRGEFSIALAVRSVIHTSLLL